MIISSTILFAAAALVGKKLDEAIKEHKANNRK